MSPQTGDDVAKTAHIPLTMRSNCNFMYFFVAKNDLRPFFVAKTIYALHVLRKTI